MTDLKSQLKIYMRETSIPVDIDGLVGGPENEPGDPVAHGQLRPRWRLAVAVGAALLALLVIGAPLVILGVFSSGPVIEDPTATTTVPATSAVAPELPQAATYSIGAAMDDVADFHDLWNSGDVAAFTGAFSDPRQFEYDKLAIAMQVVEARLDTDCEPGAATVSGAVEITCAVTLLEDRFYTPADVRWTRDVTYVVDETGVDTDMGSSGAKVRPVKRWST